MTENTNTAEQTTPPEMDRVADLQKQLQEARDNYTRALAEAENTRRRAAKEREDTAKYAVSQFAREMLTVADNFSRALGAVPPEGLDDATKNLVQGIEATQRQLMATFDRFGIKPSGQVGEAFDPNLHRVMSEAPSADVPAGHIVQVLQPGFVIEGRLLREALVVVASSATTTTTEKKLDTSV